MSEESRMALVAAVAVAASIALGGAAIALTYSCCKDVLSGRSEKKKKQKQGLNFEEEEQGVTEHATSSVEIRESERSSLLDSTPGAARRKVREQGGSSTDTEQSDSTRQRPAKRTPEEIRAHYRSVRKDPRAAALAASQAREKLHERGEKLEVLGQKTHDLQANAESFASLAQELAQKMESRKWRPF